MFRDGCRRVLGGLFTACERSSGSEVAGACGMGAFLDMGMRARPDGLGHLRCEQSRLRYVTFQSSSFIERYPTRTYHTALPCSHPDVHQRDGYSKSRSDTASLTTSGSAWTIIQHGIGCDVKMEHDLTMSAARLRMGCERRAGT